jgi:cobalamin-dependent methionine synthase I
MTILLDKLAVKVTRDDILERIEHSPDRGPSDIVLNSIDNCLRQYQSLISARGVYVIREIEGNDGRNLTLSDGIRFNAWNLTYAFRGCPNAAVFVVTIGDAIEQEASRLMKQRHAIEGYILDAIGSCAAESAADSLQAELAKIAQGRNQAITLRYSPGYCGWNIVEQKIIFQAIDAFRIGVSLTDSCLMLPRKSVSAIIAMGEPAVVAQAPCPCEQCDDDSCRELRMPRRE